MTTKYAKIGVHIFIPLFLLQVVVIKGGFVDNSTKVELRNLASPVELPRLGSFIFPDPYNTLASRLTNPDDYESNYFLSPNVFPSSSRPITNNHAGADAMYILYGIFEGKIGGNFYLHMAKVNKRTLSLIWMHDLNRNTAKEYYFSFSDPLKYYYWNGTVLFSARFENEVVSSVSVVMTSPPQLPSSEKNYYRNPRTSGNDQVHSLEIYAYNKERLPIVVGCYVASPEKSVVIETSINDAVSTCEIDRSGEYAVLRYPTAFKVVKISDMSEQMIDIQGFYAPAFVLGYRSIVYDKRSYNETNFHRYYAFDFNIRSETLVYEMEIEVSDFLIAGAVSFSWNHAIDRPFKEQSVCRIIQMHKYPLDNFNQTSLQEIGCFKLDGSREMFVVAPTMSNFFQFSFMKEPILTMAVDQSGEFVVWNSIHQINDNMRSLQTNGLIASIGVVLYTPSNDPAGTPGDSSILNGIPDWAWAAAVILFVVIVGAWVGLAIWITRVKFRIRQQQQNQN